MNERQLLARLSQPWNAPNVGAVARVLGQIPTTGFGMSGCQKRLLGTTGYGSTAAGRSSEKAVLPMLHLE